MLPELVQDLVHLERGEDGLDQHRGPDRPPRDARRSLGMDEHVVPQPRLEMRLELGQVEIGPCPAGERLVGVVEQEQARVKQARGHRAAVDQQVPLLEVPAARPHDQRRSALVEAVRLLGRIECEGPPDGIPDRDLAADDVGPARAQRILEVGHEHGRAGVEGVDHHPGLGRSGDLHPPVVEVRRRRRHLPRCRPDIRGRSRGSRAARLHRCAHGAPLAVEAGRRARRGTGARDPPGTRPPPTSGSRRHRRHRGRRPRPPARAGSCLSSTGHAPTARRTVASIMP